MSASAGSGRRQVSRRVAGVLLVDTRGYLLLQHRDSAAPVAPHRWGLPGGGIEGDESPETAARRELLEETGLTVPGPLTLFWYGWLPDPRQPGWEVEWFVYYAPTGARQDDIVLGEGQAMVFLAPDDARSRELADSAAVLVPRFLDSADYQRLAGPAPDHAH